MKKVLCLFLCVMTMFAFSACSNENGLLSDLQISKDAIDYILVMNDQGQEVKITNQSDYAFLFNYTYQGEFPGDRLHELFLFPKARTLTICCGTDTKVTITLLEDGSIVTGEKSEGPYKMYTSDAFGKTDVKAFGEMIN